MIINLIKKRRRFSVRNCLRGYRQIKEKNKFELIRAVKNQFPDYPIPEVKYLNSKSNFLSQFTSIEPELVIKQFLIQFFTGQKFIRSFLLSEAMGTPMVVSLPKSWQNRLMETGIKINSKASTFSWYVQVLMRLAYGHYILLKLIFINTFKIENRYKNQQGHSYFVDLLPNNLPTGQIDSFDIFSWFNSMRKQNALSEKRFLHSVKPSGKKVFCDRFSIEYDVEPYYRIYSPRNKIIFILWSIRMSLIANSNLLFGRWWYALLFSEIVKAKATQLSPDFASEYLFHYSVSIYRPLWSYVPERNGSVIRCYFYSAVDQPKTPDNMDSQRYLWAPVTWPEFLVWDLFQKKQLEQHICKGARVSICGPTYFNDCSADIPPSNRPFLAVFNIDPHRQSSHFGISTLADYYSKNPKVRDQFLRDIVEIAAEMGFNVFIKPKRDIGNRMPKAYSALLRELSLHDHVTIVPSCISPFRLIKDSVATISAPFTSPTLFGGYLSIPSAYYDPSCWIDPRDGAARSAPILLGKKMLKSWLFKTIGSR